MVVTSARWSSSSAHRVQPHQPTTRNCTAWSASASTKRRKRSASDADAGRGVVDEGTWRRDRHRQRATRRGRELLRVVDAPQAGEHSVDEHAAHEAALLHPNRVHLLEARRDEPAAVLVGEQQVVVLRQEARRAPVCRPRATRRRPRRSTRGRLRLGRCGAAGEGDRRPRGGPCTATTSPRPARSPGRTRAR